MTLVVHCKRAPFDVYIGRAMSSQGFNASKWGNPFKVGRDGTPAEVIAKYEAHLRSRPDLMAALPELRGKVLGCWCAPGTCHGDVLARLANAPPKPVRYLRPDGSGEVVETLPDGTELRTYFGPAEGGGGA
jgi:hypothetical protein